MAADLFGQHISFDFQGGCTRKILVPKNVSADAFVGQKALIAAFELAPHRAIQILRRIYARDQNKLLAGHGALRRLRRTEATPGAIQRQEKRPSGG